MLPTYEEALKITEDSEAFYVQRGNIQGFEYAMFNYRLASEADFKAYDGALELRGITYLKVGEYWKCYPMLTKFFNLNQCESTEYHSVKDKIISSVENKEDGSLITLIPLPNGEVVPKTKMSFDNDQTRLVSEWLRANPAVIETVKQFPLLTFLFELVSPRNKIVLTYEKTELRLLQIRETITGEYKDEILSDFSERMNIKRTETFDYALDELIELRKTLEDIEGFVIKNIGENKFNTSHEFFRWLIHKGMEKNVKGNDMKIMTKLDYLILARDYILSEEGYVIKFTDGQMVKLKHLAYIKAHGLMDDLSKENKIIEMIIDNEIDDVLGELKNGSEEKNHIEKIVALLDRYYNHRLTNALQLRSDYFQYFKENRKEFAIVNSRKKDFGIVMRNLVGTKIPNLIKEKIKEENNKLEKAREFIDSLVKTEEEE